MSTSSITTTTAIAVVSTPAASQFAGAAPVQQPTDSATNQVAVAALTREQRIAELAKKAPKQLNLMLRKAKDSNNLEKISEIEAARAIRHAKHEQATGQKVAKKDNTATAADAASQTDEGKDFKAGKTDSKAAKANAAAPSVKPETLKKYKTDFNFAKLVISVAVNEKVTNGHLEQLAATNDSDAETYRMAQCLRNPFLAEERAQIDLVKMFMPQLYQGATCNADVFKRMIASDLGKPLARLNMRLESEKAIGEASSIALTLLAIEKKQGK